MARDRPTRRGFLAGAATATLATLAGCGAKPASLDPKVPVNKLQAGTWRMVTEVEEQTTEEINLAGNTQRVRVKAKAEAYRNEDPFRNLVERYNLDTDHASLPTTGFVAAKARVKPQLARLAVLSDVLRDLAVDRAEDRAKRELRERGFKDVRKVEETSLEIAAGPTADHRTYRAEYPYDAFEVTVRGRRVTVQAGSITVETQLGIWPYRDLLTTGAGVYPAESGTLTVEAFGTRRDIDLDFKPDRYRNDVRELITQVS